ncbi:nucleotide-binding universal stress UspA family protein [Virgibacillus natechei]|uniref:Nucleotide-binding universal stress UspA family protein n=1 Tax=Virgibacillus natechei TaxID=1216297 RepID=A0ABS4IGJ8_9BACI|nr:universal stress protein [Virgibacillus natechei]MBP1970072.1 nucleotide-binding universal stress UspA family protein [Virgibacillus natechei]UZD14153.1 universal stress protein [Virgibacillus natechei]
MTKKILVAYDGSELSKKAIHEAKYQSKQEPETEVHVISIIRQTGPNTNTIISRSLANEAAEEFRPQMQKVKEEFDAEGIEVLTEVLVSNPSTNIGGEICEYAANNEIDLIIIGSRGLGGVRKFLGSVSNNVVQNAGCPVMVVK